MKIRVMARKRLLAGIVLLLLTPLLVQCAMATATSKSDLEKRLDELARANVELQARVDELERKLRLLESTLPSGPSSESHVSPTSDGAYSPASEAPSGDAAVAMPPPPGLAVLKLSPPPATPESEQPAGNSPGPDDPSLFADDPGFFETPGEITVEPVALRPITAPDPVPGSGVSVEAATLYESALGQYQKGELEMAAEAFKLYLTKYPESAYASYATFYLGESFYQRHRYQNAMEQYRRLMMKYPESDMAPEALFKMGMCFIKLNDENSAKQAFARVVETYPFSEAARSAEAQLKKLK